MEQKDLLDLNKHGSELNRFSDILKFSPVLAGTRFGEKAPINFTQLAISRRPEDAQSIQRYLDKRGYRKIKFLGRGLYGLAFETHGSIILNIRTIDYNQYEKYAADYKIDTETVWSDAVTPTDANAIIRPRNYRQINTSNSQYIVCEVAKLTTLEEAICSNKIDEVEAEYLRQNLMVELAREGYFLWDGEFYNIGISEDFTPYVLDIGAAEAFSVLTGRQFIKGLFNQNVNGMSLYDYMNSEREQDFARMDLITSFVSDEIDIHALKKELKGEKVFDREKAREFLIGLQEELNFPRDLPITKKWNKSWCSNHGVPKQDHPNYFPQEIDSLLIGSKEKSPIMQSAIGHRFYREEYISCVEEAMRDESPEKGFCDKIRSAMSELSDSQKVR